MAHQTFIKYQFIYRILTYFFDIKEFNNQHCFEKTPKISKHHLPLICKNMKPTSLESQQISRIRT